MSTELNKLKRLYKRDIERGVVTPRIILDDLIQEYDAQLKQEQEAHSVTREKLDKAFELVNVSDFLNRDEVLDLLSGE